MLQAAPTFASG